MKRILVILLFLLILTGCKSRNDYYVFSFDDYTLAVGYDDVEFMDLVFRVDTKEELEAKEVLKNIDVSFWDNFFASVDITNYKNKTIDRKKGVITKMDLYLDNLDMKTYKIDGIELSNSVKENCDKFNGTYIQRNGYACLISKESDDNTSIVILHGDILKPDQDELSRILIYVE